MAATVVDLTDDSDIIPYSSTGLICYKVTRTIPTTSTDENNDKVVIAGPFPAGAQVWGFECSSATDMETGGPTLVVDISTGAADGTVSLDLINGSTAPRSASWNDALDAGKLGSDIGGEYLLWHTTTAATTPAQANVEFRLLLAYGVYEDS